jgi:hypothetical protein
MLLLLGILTVNVLWLRILSFLYVPSISALTAPQRDIICLSCGFIGGQKLVLQLS